MVDGFEAEGLHWHFLVTRSVIKYFVPFSWSCNLSIIRRLCHIKHTYVISLFLTFFSSVTMQRVNMNEASRARESSLTK